MTRRCCVCKKIIEYPEVKHIILEKEPEIGLCEDCNAYLDWLRTASRKTDIEAAFAFFQPVFDDKKVPMAVKDELIRIRFSHEIAEEEQLQRERYIQNLQALILTTGTQFDGYEVKEYIDVICEEVIFKNSFLKSLTASLEDMGNILSFREKELSGANEFIANARAYVMKKFRKKAASIGANAVLGVEFESSVGSEIIRVAVFGTAVVIEKKN